MDLTTHNCATCRVANKCPLKPLVEFDGAHDGIISKLAATQKEKLFDLIEPAFKPYFDKVGAPIALATAVPLSALLFDVTLLEFAAGFVQGYNYQKVDGFAGSGMLKAAIAAGWKSPQEVEHMLEEAFESGKVNA